MDNKELQMYRLMHAVYSANVPIIFKGAMVTNSILKNAKIPVVRATKDIDANWTGSKLSTKEIAFILEKSVRAAGMDVSVTAFREHGTNRSAGFFINNRATGALITKMDMDLRPVPAAEYYHFGDISFYGYTPNQIICDKTVVVSGNKIFRRAKDVVDLYSLSKCVSFSTDEIYDIAYKTNRQIGDFDAFLNRKDELKHAYDKLDGVMSKPAFDDLYDELNYFVEPFIAKAKAKQHWNSLTKEWTAEPEKTKKIRKKKELDIEI